MDWLRRRRTRSPVIVVDLTDHARLVKVVGTSHHQSELFEINGGYTRPQDDRDPSMPPEPDSIAELVTEPRNECDPLAVAVHVNRRPVGYLARAVAAQYQPHVLAIEAQGRHVICLSRIVGGYVKADGLRASFGAELFLCAPEAMSAREPEEARLR